MNSKDIIKRLKKEGWKRVSVNGSHQKFKHPKISHHIVVPHPKKDLRIGLVRSIEKLAGWK